MIHHTPRRKPDMLAEGRDWFAWLFYGLILGALLFSAVSCHARASVAYAESMPPLRIEMRLPMVSK